MPDSKPPEPSEPHARCRNLIWEPSPDNKGAVPGRYCVSRLGAVQSMDCPVFQGLPCCLFDPREDDEEPVVAGEERILKIRELLTADYLRWSYWKRVDALRDSVPPPETVQMPDSADEPPATVEADDEPAEITRHEIPPPKEEALKEKYPGQRRSEDRRRSRRAVPPEEGGPAETAPEEDDFNKGIFDLPSLDPTPEPTAPETGDAPPAPPVPSTEPGSGPDSAKATGKSSKSGRDRRPRRRNRRRRSPRRGRGSSGGKPSTGS